MNAAQGHVTASVVAGPLEDSNQPPTHVGHMLTMGHYLYIHITPERAAQWIDALTPIAKEAGK
jgi:hypothetical protein